MLTAQGGADYFSSGETNSYSDGEASGGSPDASPRSVYSSESGSESEREVFFEIFDENDTIGSKRIDLVAPLINSSVHRRSAKSKCVRITYPFPRSSGFCPWHVVGRCVCTSQLSSS